MELGGKPWSIPGRQMVSIRNLLDFKPYGMLLVPPPPCCYSVHIMRVREDMTGGYDGGVTRCYHVVITDAGILYTMNGVNGIANANEHGPLQTAKIVTKN